MSISSRRKVVMIGLPLVLIAAGGVAVQVVPGRWAARCSAVNARVSEDTLPPVRFQAPDQFQLGTPAWSKQWWIESLAVASKGPTALGTFRGALRIDTDELNGGLGEQRNLAAVTDSRQGNVLLTAYPSGHPDGVSLRVGRSKETKAWAVSDASSAVEIVPGSDQMILSDTRAGRARLTSVDRDDGKTAWCQELGDLGDLDRFGPALAAVPSSNSLFLAEPTMARSDDATVMISRRDLSDGKLMWRVPADGFHRVATVEPFRDLVLVARTGSSLSSNDRYRQFGDNPQPAGNVVQARSAADGSPRWTYSGPDRAGWMNSVVGVDGDTAVVLSQRDVNGRRGNIEDERLHPERALGTTSQLVGLGADGKERWRHDLGNRLYSLRGFGTRLAHGLALSVEGDLRRPFEKQTLVARDVATGTTRWQTPLADYTLAPDFWGSGLIGDLLLTGSQSEKLISVDLRTGAVAQPLGENTGFGGLVVDDQTVTVDASGLLLTFDRPR